MQLYYSPAACSLASHITLREAGLPFELERADVRTKKLEDGSDYLAINPKGAVPALKLDDGKVLTEGVAIMQYVADHKPDSGLAPKNGTFERYQLQEWLNYLTSELHKSFSPLWNPANDQAVKQYALDNLAKKFEYLDKHLTGRKFLTGDTFTIADAYAFVLLNWATPLNVDLSKYPAIREFQARVAARPKVKEAMEAEGLFKKAA